ncbi:MAG: hypothetical protein ACFCUV_03865 [Rivularia sp. (in: cyanobacteria)]
MYENDLSGIIIGCAMQVHTALGAGLLEFVGWAERSETQHYPGLCLSRSSAKRHT